MWIWLKWVRVKGKTFKKISKSVKEDIKKTWGMCSVLKSRESVSSQLNLNEAQVISLAYILKYSHDQGLYYKLHCNTYQNYNSIIIYEISLFPHRVWAPWCYEPRCLTNIWHTDCWHIVWAQKKLVN